MSPSIRLIMLGTGDFALPTFEHLIDTGHQVVALITQPDRPQGRKQEIIESLIKQSAEARGVLTLQPEDVNSPESLDLVRSLHADLLVTAAYGQILSPALLAIPRHGRHQPSRFDPAGLSGRGPGRTSHSERRDARPASR